ncbi:MAG: hypothetical protein IMZ55_11885, partial [Acidobacteria bacterium]|nr:hypothetical protein [Acidobacteriota bacterium]
KVIGPQIGQLLLLAEFPQRPLDLFTKETRAVIEAYKETWGVPKQFLSRDATIRCLYSCDNCKHAFQFLWEQLLGQTGGKTAYLGKPIWGGGLRFVMPPEEKEQPEPTQVEVKVESFLGDPEKLFVETQLSWPQPSQDDMFAKAEELLARVESYISQHVLTFLTQGD